MQASTLVWERDAQRGIWTIQRREGTVQESEHVKFANDPQEPTPTNLMTMRHLNEPCLVHELSQQYVQGHIYTETGTFTTAVNPYRIMSELYSDEVLRRYNDIGRSAGSGREAHAHVYGVADNAFRSMIRELEISRTPADQVILISGESGAGKTETTKHVMRYLTKAGTELNPHTHLAPATDTIMDQVLESNPVLEAFGNASTVRNLNSSRFGKFIEMHFDNYGCLLGATIRTYLLEKVRVTSHAPGEKTYHIFYQMCCGASAEERQDWRLRDDFAYHYLQPLTLNELNREMEAEEWRRTYRALEALGFVKESLKELFECMSGLLWLGNITFQQEGDGSGLTGPAREALEHAAFLLKLEPEILQSCLCQGSCRGATVHRTPEQCAAVRDSTARAIYSQLFDWVVTQVNMRVRNLEHTAEATIGILDIFGFERFQENSIEQLCINYTNEMLQQHFTRSVVQEEQDEYESEGIMWERVEHSGDSQVLELLARGPTSIFQILEDQCKQRRRAVSDVPFLQGVYATHKETRAFVIDHALRARDSFAILHYAGRVDYLARGFVEKNIDKLSEEIELQLQKSGVNVLKQVFSEGITSGQRTSSDRPAVRRGSGVAQKFCNAMDKLMEKICKMAPHYIRCIKPNDQKHPNIFDANRVGEQLHSGGVVDALRVARMGFPIKYTHRDFVNRYESVDGGVDNTTPDRDRCRKILRLIDESHWENGAMKVFLRSPGFEKLERILKLIKSTILAQSLYRGRLCRRRTRKLISLSRLIRKSHERQTLAMRARALSIWREIREKSDATKEPTTPQDPAPLQEQFSNDCVNVTEPPREKEENIALVTNLVLTLRANVQDGTSLSIGCWASVYQCLDQVTVVFICRNGTDANPVPISMKLVENVVVSNTEMRLDLKSTEDTPSAPGRRAVRMVFDNNQATLSMEEALKDVSLCDERLETDMLSLHKECMKVLEQRSASEEILVSTVEKILAIQDPGGESKDPEDDKIYAGMRRFFEMCSAHYNQEQQFLTEIHKACLARLDKRKQRRQNELTGSEETKHKEHAPIKNRKPSRRSKLWRRGQELDQDASTSANSSPTFVAGSSDSTAEYQPKIRKRRSWMRSLHNVGRR